MSELIKNRYDFIIYFDVTDGNPNGDPDAGNMPRIDAETGMGIVTDVCLKRKVRNYIQLSKNQEEEKNRYDIYVKEKAVLGRAHKEAFEKLGITLGEGAIKPIPEELIGMLEEYTLPEGLTIEEDEENDTKKVLVVADDADTKLIKEYLKESKPDKKIKDFITSSITGIKSRKPKPEETEKGRDYMCRKFYDIRTFGAVLSLKSAPNCGQVRGPVQFTFGRSVDPIIAFEHSITRMAVATEKEAEKQSGDNRTMGRKFTVPYGLYRAHGFISPQLASQTGFNEEDLNLFWNAVVNMFEHDRSAARGLMSIRKVVVFKHESALGNAPANVLFDLVTVKRSEENANLPARKFSDYKISVDKSKLPAQVEIIEKI